VLFDTFELTGSETALAAQMATFWTNFAATGDPNLGQASADAAGPSPQSAPPPPPSHDDDTAAAAAAAADALASGRRQRLERDVQTMARHRSRRGGGDSCAPYRPLQGAELGRLNGTVTARFTSLSTLAQCCSACAHRYYHHLCDGYRWHGGPTAVCELLGGGRVRITNASLPGPRPTAAAIRRRCARLLSRCASIA
jgi:hypothetical protein